MNEEKLKALYEATSQNFDLGSFEDFSSKMSNPEKRKTFYGAASKDFELGSFEEFESKIIDSSKKKDDTQSELSSETTSLDSQTEPSTLESGDDLSERDELEQRVSEAREDSSFLNVLNNVGNNFQNIGNGIGILLQDLGNLSSAVTEAVTEFSGGEVDTRLQEAREESIETLSRYVDENNKQIDANTIARSYDPSLSLEENIEVGRQGIVETFEKDGSVAGIGEVAIKALESSPYLITSMITGGLGGSAATASTFFATGYGNSIAEQYASRDSDEESISRSKAVVDGTIEGITSVMFGGVSKYAKKAAKSLGLTKAKKIIKNNISNHLKKNGAQIFKTSAGEGFEELVQEVAGYAVDVAYESDDFERDFNLDVAREIGIDALILGSASGAGVSGVGSSINSYKYAKAKASQNKSIKAINEELELQSTKDNPAKERILKRKRDLLLGEIEYKEISDEDADKLNSLYFEQEELNQLIKSTQSKDLRSEMKDELKKVEQDFNSIFEKYDSRPEETTQGENLGDQKESRTDTSDEQVGDGDGISGEQASESKSEVETDERTVEDIERDAFEEVDDPSRGEDRGVGGKGEGAEFRDTSSKINKTSEPLSESELQKNFVDVLSEIKNSRFSNEGSKVAGTKKALSSVGKAAKKVESTVFKNYITEKTSRLTSSVYNAIDNYIESPIRNYVTKPIVKSASYLGKSAAKGVDVFEEGIRRSLNKYVSESISTDAKSSAIMERVVEAFTPNVVRRESEQSIKPKLSGSKDLGKKMTEELNSAIKSHSAYNYNSLGKIHAVMDPEASSNIVGSSFYGTTYEFLSDSEKEMHGYLRAINDYTHELNYSNGLIDKSTYEKNKGSYIARMYMETEMNGLDALRESGAINQRIYKKRKEELSEDMDSVTDPVYLTMKRFAQTQQNVAIKSYTDQIFNEGGSHLTKDEFESIPEGERINYTLLSSGGANKSFGKLEGMYVKKHFAEDLYNQEFLGKVLDGLNYALNWYDKSTLRQLSKKGLTVYNPMTRLVNITSGTIFAHLSGVDPISFTKNRVNAKSDYGKLESEDYMYLLKEGVIGTSNMYQELTVASTEEESITAHDEEERKRINKLFKPIHDNLKSFDKVAVESYIKADDITKMSVFKSLKEQGFSNEEALDRTKKFTQNYSSVGKAYSIGAKIPIFGNTFVRFQADLMRIMGNAAIEKPLTSIMMIGAIHQLGNFLSELSGEEDEEKFIRESRSFIPKLNLPFTDFDIPLVYKVGDKTEINVAKYLTPYYDYDLGSLDDNIYSWKFSPVNIYFKDGSIDFKTGDPTLGWVVDLFRDKDFRSKSIRNPNNKLLSDRDEAMNMLLYAARNSVGNVIPVRLFNDMYLSANYGKDYYGRSRTVFETIVSRVVKIEEWDDSRYKEEVQKFFTNKDYELKGISRERENLEYRLDKDVNKLLMDSDLSRTQIQEKIQKTNKNYIEKMIDLDDKEIEIYREMYRFSDKVRH